MASAHFAVRMSPEQWALCLAVGVVLGIFPAPACPTLFCAAAALALRLNPPAMQAVNYLASPLQVALFAPLARLGDRLLSHGPGPAAIGNAAGFQATVWRAAAGLIGALGHAMTAWLLVCAPLGILLYALARPAFRRAMRAA